MPKSLVYFLFAQEGKETFRGKKAIVNNLKQPTCTAVTLRRSSSSYALPLLPLCALVSLVPLGVESGANEQHGAREKGGEETAINVKEDKEEFPASHKERVSAAEAPAGAAVSAPTVCQHPPGTSEHMHTRTHTQTPAFDFLHTYIVISTPPGHIHIINTGSFGTGSGAERSPEASEGPKLNRPNLASDPGAATRPLGGGLQCIPGYSNEDLASTHRVKYWNTYKYTHNTQNVFSNMHTCTRERHTLEHGLLHTRINMALKDACGHCMRHARKFFQGHVNIPDAFGYKQASKLESGNSI
ncbi:hypothetical protein D9C73_017168 [Collichthys lucidus]|uniref:Uncharacterized protein n=1 Tax=Collichthys lucidus TaxID=240159 RepID=A0A4U5V640_COLLU|nr:hypothetical protein D9C73_017168 [Collichthys lucidus]